MLEQLKDRISDIQTIGSIELQMDANGNSIIHWLILSKRKQLLVIEKSGTLEGDYSLLSTVIPTSIPLVVSLSGKGILHKKVQQQGSDKEKLFNHVFPNARINEYTVQYLSCSSDSFYVSVVRKDQVERTTKEIMDLGYSLLSISLGGFCVVPLLKAIHYPNGQLIAGKHQLLIQEGTPAEYSYTNQETDRVLDIAGQEIPSYLLVVYAMAFQYVLKGIEKVEVTDVLFVQLQEEYKEKTIFKTLSIGGLVFFFLLLIVNTIAYSILSGENNRLSAQYGSLQHITVSNKKSTEEFNRKESFLSTYGWLNPPAISFYSDRIASTLPPEIQLTSLFVYPLNESLSRKEKKEVFEPSVIIIKGISAKPTDINDWVKDLNTFNWISQIKVQDYSFDLKTGRGNFSLHVMISGELE